LVLLREIWNVPGLWYDIGSKETLEEATASSRKNRHGASQAIADELREFVKQRTLVSDRQAITARLPADCGKTTCALSPRPPDCPSSISAAPSTPSCVVAVRRWLRRHCPGYRTSRIFWRAGHNVLLSAPRDSAEQILAWMNTSGT